MISERKQESFPARRRIVATLKLFHYIGGAFVIATMVLTTFHAVGRYCFNAPILGAIDLAQCALVATVFLTGAYTMIEKRHLTINLIVDNFPSRGQAITDFITYSLSLVVVGLMLWQSIVQGIYLMHTTYGSFVLNIPVFPFYFLIAFGLVLLMSAIILHLINFILIAVKR